VRARRAGTGHVAVRDSPKTSERQAHDIPVRHRAETAHGADAVDACRVSETEAVVVNRQTDVKVADGVGAGVGRVLSGEETGGGPGDERDPHHQPGESEGHGGLLRKGSGALRAADARRFSLRVAR